MVVSRQRLLKLGLLGGASLVLPAGRLTQAILADATVPISIACVPGCGFTFGATSLDLASPPRMRVAPGPPHCTAYVELSFDACDT